MKTVVSKPKPKPKAGKVVRITKDLVKSLNKDRLKGETWSQVISRRTKGRETNVMKWALPSKLYSNESAATGASIEEAAKNSVALPDRELPVKVWTESEE